MGRGWKPSLVVSSVRANGREQQSCCSRLERKGNFGTRWYCWWTKSCTTKDDDYPIIYRVLTIPGGAGFRPSTVWDFLFFHGSNMKQWPVTHIDWIWRRIHVANHGAPKMEPKWWWFNEGIPETFRYRNSMDNAYILSSRPSLLSIIHFHATAIPSQATRVCTSWTRHD